MGRYVLSFWWLNKNCSQLNTILINKGLKHISKRPSFKNNTLSKNDGVILKSGVICRVTVSFYNIKNNEMLVVLSNNSFTNEELKKHIEC